jgi:hypothetical protein
VALDDFIGMDNDTSVFQELVEDEIVSQIFMRRNGASGDMTPGGEREDDINDENIITVTEAADMAQSLQHFVMTRKMFWTVLDSGEIP